jgi:phage/plasmid-associated DNA primase
MAICTRDEAGGVMLFLNECCDRSPALRTDGRELYEAYLKYVKSEGRCSLDYKTFEKVLDYDHIYGVDGSFVGVAVKP